MSDEILPVSDTRSTADPAGTGGGSGRTGGTSAEARRAFALVPPRPSVGQGRMAEPVRKLYQQVAERITDSIRRGAFAPGARLPAERDLAEEFEVSRPTIREAMIALEIRGFVEARQGSGIYVTERMARAEQAAPELDVGAFELIEARTLFEGEAAALAATAIGPEALAELRKALTDMDKGGEGPAALEADRRFHMAIADATANSLVRLVIEMLWNIRERSPLCIHMFAQAQRKGVTPRVGEHREIVDALEARDPQRARDAMRSHLRRVTEDLLEATKLEIMQKAQADFDAQASHVTRRTLV